MYRILKKRPLHDTVTLMEIEAPHVARKARPGQFIIFRIDEEGERIPLTIAGYDRQKGSVTIIFQKVGATTRRLGELNDAKAAVNPSPMANSFPERSAPGARRTACAALSKR